MCCSGNAAPVGGLFHIKSKRNVAYWHRADLDMAIIDVRYRG
jgi:hypothetical protein